MASSSLPLKRFLTSIPLSRSFLRPLASSAARSFKTINVFSQHDEHADDSDSDVDRSSDHLLISRADYFSDGSEIFEHPYSPAVRGGWDAKETEDAMHLRVDMPGLGKKDVKISVKPNTFTLTIKREGAKESSDEEEGARRYSSRIDLPNKVYKFDQIKAEMKNGELKVVVPKRKEEERTDVFNVKIE